MTTDDETRKTVRLSQEQNEKIAGLVRVGKIVTASELIRRGVDLAIKEKGEA